MKRFLFSPFVILLVMTPLAANARDGGHGGSNTVVHSQAPSPTAARKTSGGAKGKPFLRFRYQSVFTTKISRQKTKKPAVRDITVSHKFDKASPK